MKQLKIGIVIMGVVTFIAMVGQFTLTLLPQFMPTPLEIDAESVRSDPGNYKAYELYGYQLLDAKQPEHAESEFRKEIKIQPSSLSAHYLLGKALAAQGRYAEAQTEWKIAMKGAKPRFAKDVRAAIDSTPSQ